MLLASELADDSFAVDIVDACAGSRLEKYIECVLKGTDFKLCNGLFYNDIALLAADDNGNDVCAFGQLLHVFGLAVIACKELDIALAVLLCELVHEAIEEGFGVDVEYDPVDGLEDDTVIVYVFKLNKSIACRMVLALFFGEVGFELLPVCFCGSEAVVAVAHCEETGSHFGSVLLRLNEPGKSLDNACYHILILDEPFSGLDPLNAQVFKDTIKRFVTEGKLVIFSSHQMSYVEEICDDISLIHEGNILLTGDLDLIKREMGKGKLQLKVREQSAQELEQSLRASFPDLVIQPHEEGLILGGLNGVIQQDVFGFITEKGLTVESFGLYTPSLNDVFIQKVGENE